MIAARSRIVTPPGMGEPTTLLRALASAADGRDWTLCSGLMFGTYPFLPAVEAGTLTYETWHVMPPVRDYVATGQVGYVPARASALEGHFRRRRPGAALVRVSPPDHRGLCSLGPSTSYGAVAIETAEVAIAEVDPDVPRTCGDSLVPLSAFAATVESAEPIPAYRAATASDVAVRIAQHVLALLPPRPTLQIGIGGVPEALVRMVGDADLGGMRFVGMATDDMVDLWESGVLSPTSDAEPSILSPEMHGSRKLLDWCDRNPVIQMHRSSLAHDAARLGAIDRFVSVNSALEVDLYGNVNSEVRAGMQVSGTGGGIDYLEAATRSRDGLRIIALPATSSDGTASKIVARAETVSIPRSMVDVVVTEHGAVRLAGLSAQARAEALIGIAAPQHRDALATVALSTPGRAS